MIGKGVCHMIHIPTRIKQLYRALLLSTSITTQKISLHYNMKQKSLFQFYSDKALESHPPENIEKKTKAIQPSIEMNIIKSTHTEEDVMYETLCDLFDKIENETKRLIIHEYLRSFFYNLFKMNLQTQLLYSIYLCVNRVGPVHEGAELGLGESILLKAVASSTGKTPIQVKVELGKLGDLGKVVETSRQNQTTMIKPKRLTMTTVFNTLKEITLISGANSIQRKVDKVKFLLVSCHGNESKFLIRSLEGKLRIGLAEQSVIIALAQAAVLHYYNGDTEESSLDFESGVNILKSVMSQLPVYDLVIPALIDHGIFELETHCHMTPGIPVKPMLAHPTKSLTEVLDRFENRLFTCEYKYDGERTQIHQCEDGQVIIFSRNLENLSIKYPDIVEKIQRVEKHPSVKTFVLDCEAVAWDPIQRKLLSFQVLSTRKRKDVSIDNIKVQICLFAFDLLFLNGESLLRYSLQERRSLLFSLFKPLEEHFQFVKYIDSTNINDIQTLLDDSFRDGCEGLMVKTLEEEHSSYEPSKRSMKWLKVKKDYLAGIGDSLDLVVIGGDYGRGKRTGVYGGFLLATYDDEQEVYQPICKLGTGLSEDDLEKFSTMMKECLIPGPKAYYDVAEGIKPDEWFDAVYVWEVKAADFSISPLYSAAKGLIDPGKGLSLRFPRFVRVRDDKTPEQATTSSQVAELYNIQISKMKHEDINDEEEY